MSILLNFSTSHSDAHDFTATFPKPILLDPKCEYEIALNSASIWYSYKNISAAHHNNKLSYSADGGTTWITWTLPDGLYQLADLNTMFRLKQNDDGNYTPGASPDLDEYHIEFRGNFITGQVVITITDDDYQVDISNSEQNDGSLISRFFGFDNDTIITDGKGEYASTNIPDVNWGISSLGIHSSIVSGSYNNGKASDLLWAFTPDVYPYYVMNIVPNQLVFLPLKAYDNSIQSINIRLCDQDGNPINPEQASSYSLIIRKKDSSRFDLGASISSSLIEALSKIPKVMI
jgi:hypothetical protein